VVVDCVDLDACVQTDGWQAYDQLENEGFEHEATIQQGVGEGSMADGQMARARGSRRAGRRARAPHAGGFGEHDERVVGAYCVRQPQACAQRRARDGQRPRLAGVLGSVLLSVQPAGVSW
jgi:hypothetical protein